MLRLGGKRGGSTYSRIPNGPDLHFTICTITTRRPQRVYGYIRLVSCKPRSRLHRFTIISPFSTSQPTNAALWMSTEKM